MKLNAQQLRTLEETTETTIIDRKPIYFILDSIYDTYNVGGLFRLADALAATKIYLCGDTETPPNHKIKKASIGTYKIVPWEYCATARDAISKLKTQNSKLSVVAIEQHERAVPYTDFSYTYPIAFVLGNETNGIAPETLERADAIVEIPMFGINKSLNVIVSAAIVSYHAVTSCKTL